MSQKKIERDNALRGFWVSGSGCIFSKGSRDYQVEDGELLITDRLLRELDCCRKELAERSKSKIEDVNDKFKREV
uniref:Uncharacterized protein n=1 Tax=viral metagenome TaxID=1070528 RepID=A0A6M3J406_9ZZZZ